MSALAMILTAAMIVPGDGAEKVSGEITKIAKLQRLDLSGEWKSYFKGVLGFNRGAFHPEWYGFSDEGAGWLRLSISSGDGGFLTCYGIYEQEGDRLKICFSTDGKSRPTRFYHGGGQWLWELRRVKSRK